MMARGNPGPWVVRIKDLLVAEQAVDDAQEALAAWQAVPPEHEQVISPGIVEWVVTPEAEAAAEQANAAARAELEDAVDRAVDELIALQRRWGSL